MNVHTDSNITTIPNSVELLLRFYDQQNHIDPDMWVAAKATMINKYFSDHGLKAAIVAVSGGIDSAVVFALLQYAKKLPNSPIETIKGVFLPHTSVFGGATGQEAAASRVRDLANIFGKVDTAVVTYSVNETVEACERMTETLVSDWVRGQSVAYNRTPYLYSLTSALTSLGQPAIVIGTTNLDEGSYLGYVGKASDGMVDLQVISDLRKHHVFDVAKYLGVPKSILKVTPTGDMFDGRTDEQVFGTTYEYARLYQYLLLDPWHASRLELIPAEDKFLLQGACNNLENLHRYNSHKYLSGSPAVHLDIFPTNIIGGWNYNSNQPYQNQPDPVSSYRNIDSHIAEHLLCSVKQDMTNMESQSFIKPITTKDNGYSTVFCVRDTIPDQLLTLLDTFDEWHDKVGFGRETQTYPTDNHGQKCLNIDSGSNRIVFVSEHLADILYDCLGGMIPRIKFHEGEYWRLVSVNPYMRHMTYKNGAHLHAHRDGNHVYSADTKNLMSLIVYLTDNTSGATRFLTDRSDAELVGGTSAIANDWKHESTIADAQFTLYPTRGQMVAFDTYCLHDSARVVDETKVVLLTELAYTRIITPNAKNLHREIEW